MLKFKIVTIYILFFYAMVGYSSDRKIVSEHVFLGNTQHINPLKDTDLIKALKKNLSSMNNSENSIVFMGSSFPYEKVKYSFGNEQVQDSKYIQLYTQILENFKGHWYFLPGNSEWADSGEYGFKRVNNLQKMIEDIDGNERMFPEEGCPGPDIYPISNELIFLNLDTQWYIHKYKTSNENSDCDSKTASQFRFKLDTYLSRYKDKQVIVLGYHPIDSPTVRAGHYSWKDHLFPIRNKKGHRQAIPLPIIGSLKIFYEKTLKINSYYSDSKYKSLQGTFEKTFSSHPNTIYISGQDNFLRYFEKSNTHRVVSGSFNRHHDSYQKGMSNFISGRVGYAKIVVYSDQSYELVFYGFDDQDKSFKPIFTKPLFKSVPKKIYTKIKNLPITKPRKIVKPIDKSLKGGRLKKAVLGSNHRDIWNVPVNVPVFRFKDEKNTYTIDEIGGSSQSVSVHMYNQNGQGFKLRSISKTTKRVLKEVYYDTVIDAIHHDQNSTLHPFGALVVPTLAKALNLYHTSALLVYVEKNDELGRFKNEIPEGFYMLEDRPKYAKGDEPHFGRSTNIISTTKAMKRLRKEKDYEVDQETVLKARLLDIVIGDRDRHDDQWRWLIKKENGLNVMYPIPRDRDQVFNKTNGFLGWLVRREWMFREHQNFSKKVNKPTSLAISSNAFDRTFLNKLSWNQWEKIITEVQSQLTPEIIKQAINQMPEELPKNHKQFLYESISVRLKNLNSTARTIFINQTKEMNIASTDFDDHFIIQSINPVELSVKIYNSDPSKKGVRLIYSRIFNSKVTKEINLFGLKGNDTFKFLGAHKVPIKVRTVGGYGKDLVAIENQNEPVVKIHVYDTNKKITFPQHSIVKDKSNADDRNTEYLRKDHKYNVTAPIVYIQNNPDDGIMLGAGFDNTRYGFHKNPYKSRHVLKASFAPRGLSGNFSYNGDWQQIFPKTNISAKLAGSLPQFRGNFYGLGNNTEIDPSRPRSYYWIQSNTVSSDVLVERNLLRHVSLRLGPTFDFFDLKNENNRFILDLNSNTLEPTLGTNTNDNIQRASFYVGPKVSLSYDRHVVDLGRFIEKRIYLKSSFKVGFGLRSEDSQYYAWNTEGNLRGTLQKLKTIYSLNLGYGRTGGDYEFFQAQYLGRNSGLEGFFSRRFAGDQKYYQNLSLKTRLGTFKTSVLPITFGSKLYAGQGRVWLDGESSNRFYKSYGFGAWFLLLDKVQIETFYAFPETSFAEGIFAFNFSTVL